MFTNISVYGQFSQFQTTLQFVYTSLMLDYSLPN